MLPLEIGNRLGSRLQSLALRLECATTRDICIVSSFAFYASCLFLLAGKKTFVLECSIKARIPQACAVICRIRSMYRKRYSSKHSCITVHRHLFWPSYFAHIPNGCTFQSQSETLWPAAKLGPKRLRQHAALFLHSSCDCVFLCLGLCVFPCLIT